MKQKKLLLVGALMLSVVVFAGCDNLRLMRYIGAYAGTLKVKPVGSLVDLEGSWQFTVVAGGRFTGKCLIKGHTNVYDVTGSVNSDGSFSGSWDMPLGSLSLKFSFVGTISNKTVTGKIKTGEAEIGTLEGKKVSVLEQLIP